MELTKLQEKIKKESQGNLIVAVITGWGGVACGLCFLVVTILTAINPGVNHPSPETALQDLLLWSAPFIFNGFFVGCVSLFSAKLFHRIGKSHTPFSPENTKQLKALSRISILMGLLLLCYNSVMTMAFDDQRMGIGAFALTYFIVGVIFDMFARIFEYGRQLQQESDETL
jgi:hypothetical protein